jgi:hypothetical protein
MRRGDRRREEGNEAQPRNDKSAPRACAKQAVDC